jgi:hypothetical protein
VRRANAVPGDLMNTLRAMAWTAPAFLVATAALADERSVMARGTTHGGGWSMDWLGSFGDLWLPALLMVAVVGLVAWSIKLRHVQSRIQEPRRPPGAISNRSPP